MRKIVFFIIAIVYCLFNLSCDTSGFENKTYVFNAFYDDLPNPGFKFSFLNGIFKLEIPELDDRMLEEGEYIHRTIVEPYSLIREGDFRYIQTISDKYLIIAKDEICILISQKTRNSFWGIEQGSEYVRLGNRLRQNHIGLRGGMLDFQKVSSYLSEVVNGVEKKYNGISQYYYDILVPWAEGVDGDGIGEWMKKRIAYQTEKVVLINGYIDPTRIDLYEKNSRVKSIEIENGNNKWIYDLEDTQEPQILTLPEKVTGEIKFTIKDIYPGSMYSDTCIAGIFFLTK